jgi:hypothetical protein
VLRLRRGLATVMRMMVISGGSLMQARDAAIARGDAVY